MSHSAAELQKPTGEYRQYLPDLSLKRFQVMRNQDAHEYAHDFKTLKNPPWLHALYMHWVDLLQEPFKGVTTDGRFFFSDTFTPHRRFEGPMLINCERKCSPRLVHAPR